MSGVATRTLPVMAGSSRAYDELPDAATLVEWIGAGRYHGYAYAYPHKTAYRALAMPVSLDALWAEERRDALALYVHVPFCEFRCGFCNLFAAHGATDDDAERFVAALERQARAVRERVGALRIETIAIGGGTPTWLAPRLLARVLDVARSFAPHAAGIPFAIETSPATATEDRLAMVRDAGVSRVSIGVQSFSERTRRALGRPDRPDAARTALERIARSGIPGANVDLVYGAPGQTDAEWLEDLEIALSLSPSEIYLYPLYVRPATGLGRRDASALPDRRAVLYAIGRERLRDAGYLQRSMRSFARDAAGRASAYRCQRDGTIGLGPGARSYTHAIHYADPWSVGARSVRTSVAAYDARDDDDLAHATWGIALDDEERHRRYVMQSLLETEGLDVAEHDVRFPTGRAALDGWLRELRELGLATDGDQGRVRLTTEGIACSDAIGPWLYSPRVRAAMATFEVR